MKVLTLLLAFTMFCLPATHGQTFAFVAGTDMQPAKDPSAVTGFAPYRQHSINQKALWGGIIAATGGGTALVGEIAYSYLGVGDGRFPENTSMMKTGMGLMIAGGIMIVAGSITGIIGMTEVHRRYGWQIVAPKSNEAGIAYNF